MKTRLPVNIDQALLDRMDALTKKMTETSGFEVNRTQFVEKAIRELCERIEKEFIDARS